MVPVPHTLVQAEPPGVVSGLVATQMIASSTPVLVVDARDGDAQYRERVKGSIDPPSALTLKTSNAYTVLVYDNGTTTLSLSATPANRELARLHALGLPRIALLLVKGGLPALRAVAPHLVLPPASLPPHMAQIPWAKSAFRAMHAQYAAPAEILPGLFVGAAVHASNPQWLSENKVTHVLAVGEEFQPPIFKYPALSWSRIPVKDHPSENLVPFFANALRFINDALDECGVVMVHCLAGASRSVATVAAYLVSLGWSLDGALTHMKALRLAANPNPGFVSQLRTWEIMCLNNTPRNEDGDAAANETPNSFPSDTHHTNGFSSSIPMSPITPPTPRQLLRRRCDSIQQLKKRSASSPAFRGKKCEGTDCNNPDVLERNFDSRLSEDEDFECHPSASLLQ